MNIEHIREWVAALRSDRFQQGTGALASFETKDEEKNPSYCCLGVACELAGVNKEAIHDETDYHEDTEVSQYAESGRYYFDGSHELPPVAFAEWLGFDVYDHDNPHMYAECDWQIDYPEYHHDNPLGWTQGTVAEDMRDKRTLRGQMTCANLNDGGFTFEQIADCIEYFGIAGPA